MRPWSFVLIATALNLGCTTMSLERHTVNQALSVSDLRYQQVLDNLATLRANPSLLPSFSIVADGLATVSDTATVDSKTFWDHALVGFGKETLMFSGKHNPDLNWTLDPVADPEQLRALQAAFLWALQGGVKPGSDDEKILKQFRVADKMTTGWLHWGQKWDVPKDACYKAHCGNVYAWVCPEGMRGLSQLTLVLLDIATVDPTSLNPQMAKVVTHLFTKDGEVAKIEEGKLIQQDPKNHRIVVERPTLNKDQYPDVDFGTVGEVPLILPNNRTAVPRAILRSQLR